ncbi:MAG TPA: LL-diaminopimelate aminotransferase [Firmicutes bacterium]|uniref:Aminotransferase n=1 Tax=Capillibacterium thermochitinicola TaxID=2699427 RepID=A0A8J6I0L0_9FIRM|nr:LL-diaminopimelate aminotransferase [Capillibacterium thermochitinicola]MBA2132127.1 LL-diaminopimelate aminotransferase [Capillibacterium thermochitinicola]HHW12644.1 LL-diaminopimelate aminotransferase [Bacillota bacterium]
MVQVNTKMQTLPPYLFARIEQKIAEARAQGIDLISLGIGDPDLPTPPHIVDAMTASLRNPANHQYPSSVGLLSFRQAVADFYQRRFGVALDPKTEVVTLIGSKEGIAHIPFCYLDPGDVSLVPDPGYPVYGIGTMLAGGTAYYMPLTAENGFKPVLADIPTAVAKKAKLMFLNYPNNPTGAVADLAFFNEVVAFAREFDILVCHDAAYSEIAYDDYRPPSFLMAPGAKEVGIEFHSLSKTYNMTGWRLGWACGNREAVEVLGRFKSNVDSGVFQAIQEAGIAALRGDQTCVEQMRRIYQERRDLVIAGLEAMGWRPVAPKAGIYIWVPTPKGFTAEEFAELVLEKAQVIITPGRGYGERGEGFFRISLTTPTDRLRTALERMQSALGRVEI